VTRIDWRRVLAEARVIMDTYDTEVTLRQCFYRLVAAGLIPNTVGAYHTLSDRTAAARRAGTFPEFADLTRQIHRKIAFADPAEAREWLCDLYRRDRTEGQAESLYIGVEKKGLVAQLEDWFADFGIPILALGGYASQTYVDHVVRDVVSQHRPAVLLYAGDFDPTGEDIDRDFVGRTGCFDKVVRVALNAEQVTLYDLPPAMGKATDPRASQFIERHGRLVQVELDALAPPDLRALYAAAVAEFMDLSAYRASLASEAADRAALNGDDK
jgi:hypothetical protein